MERFRGQVGAVRPDDCSELLIEPDLTEEGGVREWLEHAAPTPGGEVDFTLGAVLEAEPQAVIAGHLDVGDVNEIRHDDPMLWQRWDALQRRLVPRPLPIRP